MPTVLRALAVLATLMAASCSVPAESPPASEFHEPVATATPTKEAKSAPAATPTPAAPATPEVTPSSDSQTTPVLVYECTAPTLTVYDDTLGPGLLFDPSAMVGFSGSAATVTVTIDGFPAQEVTLNQDVEVPGLLEPIDLTRAFFDTRTDEDRYNGVSGTTSHHAVAVLTDEAGRSATSECTFDVTFP